MTVPGQTALDTFSFKLVFLNPQPPKHDPDPMPRLVADNLGKRFGRRVLFRKLSFELEGGRTLA